MAMNGTDLLVLVNIGTVNAPDYMAVGCQRDATIEETTDTIDASCKDSRSTRVLPGRYGATVSLDSLYIPDDQAYLVLKAAMRGGDLVMLARQEQDIVTETYNALVGSLSEAFPDQGEATVAAKFTIDGFPTVYGS